MRKFYLGALFFFIGMAAMAQQPDSSSLMKEKSLDEVVVTGQYKPQSLKNSVYQVRVITKESIQKRGASKLQDVLSSELNTRFSQDLATGGSNLNLLGLSGQNVKVLVDGLPVTGRQGTNNEIDINQIDINSIERIEIVEGPMSVVYGADALAGVINIITKKSINSKISVTARVNEETVGKEYGVKGGIHNQYIGLALSHNRWELGGGFGYNYFGGWQDTAVGRELVWHWKDQIIGNGYIKYSTRNFSIRYRFDGLDEIITNPGNYTQRQVEADDTLANDQEYLTRRLMQQLQASWFVNNNLSFNVQSAYSDYRRQVFSTNLSQKTGAVTLDLTPGAQSVVNFHGFTFRTTAQYKLSSQVSFQPGIDINMESGKGERLKEGNNTVNDYAFFISSEYTPNSRINIRPGLRFIKNSVYNPPPVIPSINTKFALTPGLDLRLSYAKGFRAPSLRELYFNFFDANHQIEGNPDLKAETSNSFTGSLSWKLIAKSQASLSATLSGFYNNVKNQIDYGLSPVDPNIYIYVNIEKYKTRGATLTANARLKHWTLAAGLGYTGRYNQFVVDDKSLPEFKWSAEANANIGYNFATIGMDVNLFYKLTGKLPFYQLANSNSQQVVTLSETKGYNWADLTINKRLFHWITLNAGIKNIFDVTLVSSSASGSVHGSTGFTPIGYGRSYFAGFVFNWNKK